MGSARTRATVLEAAPASLDYRMPAEWEKHAATWLAFPHHRTDFPGKLAAVVHTFSEMARVITQGERVRLLVEDRETRDRAARIFEDAGVAMDQVDFVEARTNRSWVRDFLPLWVVRNQRPKSKCAVKFRFNGWARYRDHKWDDAAGHFVAKHFSPKLHRPHDESAEPMILEGGSVDIDAGGTVLTTEACLVTSERARYASFERAEAALSQNLGAKKIIWLPDGIAGDDTSGHIDDFARWAPGGRLLLCQEPKKSDPNHKPLAAALKTLKGAKNAQGKPVEVVPLPMPDPVTYREDRLPASYANFYVANAAVLVPVFNDRHDQEALRIVGECFPDRPAVGVYARDLVVGLGTLHCSTMQEPA